MRRMAERLLLATEQGYFDFDLLVTGVERLE